MKTRITLLIMVAIVLSNGCKDEDDQVPVPDPTTGPIEISNAGFEQTQNGVPANWWSFNGPYQVEWTDTTAFTGSGSVSITSNNQSSGFGYWAQTITENIAPGKELEVRVTVKTDNITGQGAAIVIRGDVTSSPEGHAELFKTTQGELFIGGTHNWKEYQVKLEDPIPHFIQSITVYMMLLPNTTGQVFFDDVRVSYE